MNLSGASRPATRLLTMLEVLQARGTVSGRELAERLEVDPRTVRRYAVKLEELGIPVESDRGPYGGYRLRPGFKLPPLMLTDDEATAVVLGLIVSRQTGIQAAESAVEEALAKILRVLPTELRDRVGALEGSLGWTRTPSQQQPPATEVVLTLAAAIRRKRRASIRYATPGREESDRIVAPYGLVFHAGSWYLAADDDRSGEIRTFRVDRVRSADLRRERASPPEGFDAVEHVERSIAATPWGWRLEIVFDTTLEEASPDPALDRRAGADRGGSAPPSALGRPRRGGQDARLARLAVHGPRAGRAPRVAPQGSRGRFGGGKLIGTVSPDW